jgi:hypothetical protein
MRSLRFSSWAIVAWRMVQAFRELRLGQIRGFVQLLERLILGMEPIRLGFDPRPPLAKV